MSAFVSLRAGRLLPVLCISVLLGACGGGSSKSSPAAQAGSGINLSGTAVVAGSGAPQVFSASNARAALRVGAASNTALADASVSLVKVFADGSESTVDIGTVTTNSDGEFTIEDVPAAPSGSGASSDFYYEVRISKDDLEIKAPSAPDDDATVNVSPESNLAASMLSDMLKVPGQDHAPLPSAATVENLRELVMDNAAGLVNDGAIEIPAAETALADITLAMANGVASAGGSAQDIFKAASFESEALALAADNNASDAQAAGYLKRLVREACGQEQDKYLPQVLADALGEYLNAADNTVTINEILSAYNENYTGSDLTLDAVLTQLIDVITDLSADINAGASELNAAQRIALFASTSDGLSGSSALSIDQAYLIVMLLSSQSGPNGTEYCVLDNNLNLYGFIADLINQPSLANASIADYQIYHNSGFGCNEGSGEGHFYARVNVYAAGKTISTVTIASSDSSALDGDGEVSLNLQEQDYINDSNAVCVGLGQNVTYTITANFSDTTTASATVSRNHPRVPEASSTVLVGETFVAGSASDAAPTVVATSRPLYQWTSPDTMLTNIENDASNTDIQSDLQASAIAVKYTYEFAHVNLNVSPVAPVSSNNYAACTQVNSGALYSVDSFLPTEDCDVAACATALGVDAADIACRMNIQTYLVDENDNLLGQGAGHFRFFCVDTNDDGDCGE